MKNLAALIVLASFLISSCSSDSSEDDMAMSVMVPDVIGTYMLISITNRCPDPNDNASFESVNNEVCDAATCRMITILIRTNGTYKYKQTNDLESEEYEESGSYVINDDILTTTSSDRTVVDNFEIINNGEYLDWLVSLTDDRCQQYFRFSR